MLKKLIGIDIGGTTIKMALFDAEGTMLDKWQIPTNTEENGIFIPDEMVASINKRLADKKQNSSELLGIGIGVPGPVDDLVVKRAVNLGWSDFPLKQLMEQRLNLPVVLLNDANAAALGELWQGSADQLRDIVFVTLGTGVGGGIIVDGKILNGRHASGGEIGHIPVQSEETRLCGCGNTNCLECYGSAKGMLNTMNQLAGEEVVSNTKEIFALITQGDSRAQEALTITIDYLARAIAGILNTLDPEELVIGGGVSEAGEAFLTPLKTALDQYTFPQISGHIQLRKAALGNDAGVYGAAYQVLNAIEVVKV
nr:ROK family protein [uncultured Trichococcus sp.]